MAYEYDIKYHSEKAELYKQLQLALRKHIRHTATSLPASSIESLASELANFEKYQQVEETRVEEYRILQARDANLEAATTVDAEVVNTQQEVTQL